MWLVYILSEGDHRKCSVEEWTQKHRHTLERRVECNDDRLEVYEIEVAGVRVDSTTTYGYHTPQEDGVMQYGHSKDHRPDLPQLKLMAAAAEPSGHLLACDVHPGQSADDPLYQPLITRYVGPGRPGLNRPTRLERRVRYVITEVRRDEEAIARRQARLGWRVQATNAPSEWMSLAQCVVHYRGGWCLERDFHLVKDRPIGIQPLYVRRDDQIIPLRLRGGWERWK